MAMLAKQPQPLMPTQHTQFTLCLLLVVAALAGLITACSSVLKQTPANDTVIPTYSGTLTDFSGNWEKNYQLSDDFNTKFQLYVADIERRYARTTSETTGYAPAAGVNGNAINGLARFAEELTRMPILDIKQDNVSIAVERESDFTLRCLHNGRMYVRSNNAFGNDMCGWNKEQLVFQMQLGGGLQISHQFTLSPDGAMLNISTTVSSDLVAVPVVISNYYTRYFKNEEQYNCQQTLTRQRVCTQRGALP
jgi:hypothetical protein